jgi:hypothetical protein
MGALLQGNGVVINLGPLPSNSAGAGFVQAQRIITNSTAPATSTTFTSKGHLSTNTFRIRTILSAKWPKTGSPLGPLFSTLHGYRGACCRSITIAIALT